MRVRTERESVHTSVQPYLVPAGALTSSVWL